MRTAPVGAGAVLVLTCTGSWKDDMATVEASASPPEDRDAHERVSEEGLVSVRTLVITVIAGAVGLLAGTAAGLAAGIRVAAVAEGLAASVAVGTLTALVAAIVTWLTVAKALHALVGNKA